MPTRGAISFVFDDGYESVFTNVVPVLDRYELPAVFALPLMATQLANQEQRAITPWEKWRNQLDPRHELAAHSKNHRDLTTLTPDELRAELQDPQTALAATTLVYPGGAHSEAVVAEVKKYYQAARTVLPGIERLPPRDPWRLVTYNFTRTNFSLWRANALAVWAFLTNRWLIETYHVVDDAEIEKVHAVRLDKLAAHVAFVARLPIRVGTIRSIITNPRV